MRRHEGIFTKSSPTQAYNNYADAFARKAITIYSDVADISIETAGLRKILSTAITGLQKNMKNIKLYNVTQTQPYHQPQGSGTYPITMTPCNTHKHPLHKQTMKSQYLRKLI